MFLLDHSISFETSEEVHLYYVRLSDFFDRENELITYLSADEQKRALRFHFPIHRKRFIVARAGLRKLLSFYLDLPVEKIFFSYTDLGKPFLLNLSYQFNLSHSEDAVIYAITQKQAVGVDIEYIKPTFDAGVAKRFFSQTEYADLIQVELYGKTLILNIFPSLDTPTCAESVRHFNKAASQLKNAQVLCISADLPFAHKRFCSIENIHNVTPLSVFRHPEFGKKWGLTVIEGPLTGLLSRAIVILNATGKIMYTQQVMEIANEPDYQSALAILATCTH